MNLIHLLAALLHCLRLAAPIPFAALPDAVPAGVLRYTEAAGRTRGNLCCPVYRLEPEGSPGAIE